MNQLELTAYIIVVSRDINNYKDKTIENYIELLEDEFEITPVRAILEKAKTKLYDKIDPRHKLNFKECINYAKIIFYNLLKWYKRMFDENQIISVAKLVFTDYSVRNAEEKVIELGL